MNLSYAYFLYSSVFNAVVIAFLGFLVLSKNRKDPINRLFALFCLAIGEWAITYIGWPLAQTKAGTLLSFQLLHIGACYVSILYLHFVVKWLNLGSRFNKITIWVGYVLSTFFAAQTFSPLFIRDMVPKFSMRFWAEPGILYHFYLVVFFGLFFYSSYLLLNNFFKTSGVIHKQIGFVLAGMVLTFIGGSTNYFLWYNINIPPYGNVVGSAFVIATAYAIIRYNLLDIKLIATEAALLVMNLILLFRFLVSSGVSEFAINGATLVGSFILSIVLLQSVKKEIRRREEVTTLAHNLETANIRLQELDKQKTEFLSIASHQLRTPLSILKGFIELIKDGGYGKPTKGIVETLDSMNESNEHLIKLVDDFLDISRIEQGRTKYTFDKNDLSMIVTEVVRELMPKAEDKNMEIVYDISSGNWQATLDKEKIYNVIYNFVDNAIKYSDVGDVRVSLENEDDGVTVRVRDTGTGFGKKDEVNFFQKFYRGDNVKNSNVNGTGLGLYVCRKFIEAHGGHVWAHSPGPGKGSEFGFWIPMKVRPPAQV